jgi:tRNA-dihydrouridine synthase A
MMERTDRHFRYFLRQLTRRTVLYTEMRTTGAILHGHREFQLGFDPVEHPICLQVGGDSPDDLARASELAASYGYDALNLNVGCPSERVQNGRFGACLMRHAEIVARCAAAMQAASGLPVGVKHRIGVDDDDSYEFMASFVRTVAQAGVRHFTVHARKAILSGLSPKDNRTIPPLRYDEVFRLKAEHPELFIEINGGIATLDHVRDLLARVDGVMIGRAAWDRPYLFARADEEVFGCASKLVTRRQAVEQSAEYFAALPAQVRGHSLRVLHGLYADQPGAKRWKQGLFALVQDSSTQDFARRLCDLAAQLEHSSNSRMPTARTDTLAL